MIWPKDAFTRFEVARILGARALQISLGAPVLVKTESIEAIGIAKDEFPKIPEIKKEKSFKLPAATFQAAAPKTITANSRPRKSVARYCTFSPTAPLKPR